MAAGRDMPLRSEIPNPRQHQTKSEVITGHFTASISGHFPAFHIDFLRVKRYLGYSTIGLYSYPFRLEIIAFLRRDLQQSLYAANPKGSILGRRNDPAR